MLEAGVAGAVALVGSALPGPVSAALSAGTATALSGGLGQPSAHETEIARLRSELAAATAEAQAARRASELQEANQSRAETGEMCSEREQAAELAAQSPESSRALAVHFSTGRP